MDPKIIENDIVQNGFDKQDSCYIHIEHVGNSGYTLFSGDMIGLIFFTNRLINKFAKKVGHTYEEVIDVMGDMQKLTRKNVNVGNGKLTPFEDSETYQVINILNELEEKKKECEILKKEIKKIEFQKNLKNEENKRKIELLKSENEKLKKQILELDHENKRLVDLFGA